MRIIPRTRIVSTAFLAVATMSMVTFTACATGIDHDRTAGRPGVTATSANGDADEHGGTDAARASDIAVVDLDLVGQPVELPADFFGFNAASIVSPFNVERMLDPRLGELLRAFPAPLIRIPSGTAAQWIDWRTGAFIDAPGSPFAAVPTGRRGVTMTDWAEFVTATGAEPVWDLNVLTSSLEDQLAMLDEAERLGMPVRSIELGNELWDVRGPYVDRFPTGASYAAEMNRWIPAIRRRFPDARIAVAGADRADDTFARLLGDRYTGWNDGLLATVDDADAIVIHQYWGLPEGAAPGSDVGRTLSAGLDHWAAMRRTTLDGLGRGTAEDIEVWITEWNQAAHFAPPGSQIWAQALSVVMVGMEHALDPRVRMSLVHDIVDGVGNPHDVGPSMVYPSFTNGEDGTEPYRRTALGIALPLLFGAAAENTSVQRLAVRLPEPSDDPAETDREAAASTGPRPPETTPTDRAPTNSSRVMTSPLRGVVFSGDRTEVVLVNPSDELVEVTLPRSLSDALGHGSKATEYHAAPDASPGWDPSVVITPAVTTSGAPHIRLQLSPYSITRIVADDTHPDRDTENDHGG